MKIAALSICLATTAFSADWLHYRGPKMDGSSAESLAPWSAEGPKELWRVQVGTGCASVTVSGNRVFTAGFRDGKEVVQCLDAATGKEVWSHGWTAKLGDYLFEGGPRATPTIDGERVYMVGADGDVVCLEKGTGKPVWTKHLAKDFGGRRMDWGFSASPTIDGDNVLIDCGGTGASTIALDKKTGALVWKGGDDEAGYGSVLVAAVDGKRTAIAMKGGAVVGNDAASGAQLWRFDWETAWKINAATPLVVGDMVVFSSAYNHGAAAIRVKDGVPSRVWFTKDLYAHFNSPVHRDGALFGIDGEVGKKSALVCLDVRTGDEKWRARNVKNGSLILVGDKLLVLTEVGELVLADASAAAFKEVAPRKKVLGGRCWVQPVLADGVIYCRNNSGELVALK
jgi:outer membrane protein assembly factor BamB